MPNILIHLQRRFIDMAEMTWPDIKSAVERGYTTDVVAVGSTEQHGPHLPTMTGTRIGEELANIFIFMHGGNFPTVQATLEEAQSAYPGIEIIGVTVLTKLFECLISASAEFGITAKESGSHVKYPRHDRSLWA